MSSKFELENVDATTKILQVFKEEMEKQNRLASKISHATCSNKDMACDLLIEGEYCSLHKKEHHLLYKLIGEAKRFFFVFSKNCHVRFTLPTSIQISHASQLSHNIPNPATFFFFLGWAFIIIIFTIYFHTSHTPTLSLSH
jgi:hypothetical protein